MCRLSMQWGISLNLWGNFMAFVPSKLQENQLVEKLHENNLQPKLQERVHQLLVELRNHIVTDLELLL